MKGLRGQIGSQLGKGLTRKRTDWNLQVIKWLVHQSRPCLRAKVSVVKLEAIGPVEKDRELDVWHLEHVTLGHIKIPLFFPNMNINIAIREDVRNTLL